MKNIWGKLSILAIILSLIAIFGGGSPLGNNTSSYWDAAQGYRVDGIEVISGGGRFNIAQPINASSTLYLGGAATLASSLTVGTTLIVTGETQLASLIHGGATTTLTLIAGANHQTAANWCNNALIEVNGSIKNATITTPTAAALIADCLDTWADRKTLVIDHATSNLYYLSASTNIDLVFATPTGSASVDVLEAGNQLEVVMFRSGKAGVTMVLEQWEDSD